jgi:hypothetical protein
MMMMIMAARVFLGDPGGSPDALNYMDHSGLFARPGGMWYG